MNRDCDLFFLSEVAEVYLLNCIGASDAIMRMWAELTLTLLRLKWLTLYISKAINDIDCSFRFDMATELKSWLRWIEEWKTWEIQTVTTEEEAMSLILKLVLTLTLPQKNARERKRNSPPLKPVELLKDCSAETGREAWAAVMNETKRWTRCRKVLKFWHKPKK